MTITDSQPLDQAIEHQVTLPTPTIGHGRFSVTLASSVTGELVPRSASGRMPAFAEAVRMLRERAAAEARNDVAPLHGEALVGRR